MFQIQNHNQALSENTEKRGEMLSCRPPCNHNTFSSTRQTFHGFINLTRKYSRGLSRDQSRAILGVSKEASKQDIKDAFLKLSKTLHPDVNKSEKATEDFQRVKNAYDNLVSGGQENNPYQEDTGHHENKSPEYERWKSRQERTRDFDEYLREVRRRSRERARARGGGSGTGQTYRDYYTDFVNSKQKTAKSDGFEWDTRSEEKDNIEMKVPYNMERPFITFVRIFYQPFLRIPFIMMKHVLKTAIFLALLASVGLGYEIYQEVDKVHSNDVRPEYVEAVKKKSGTLDDIE